MFILILQFFWLYVDDLLGKGLDVIVILELLFYVSASLVPLALPLAILLSSLMTFGNLSENNELIAFKSSGMTLYRIMRPLTVFVILLAIFTFYFSNSIIPISNLKWHSMIFDIQNKKITSLLTPGVYSRDIEGYAIKVEEIDGEKNKGLTILDYTQQKQLRTIKAKEASIYKSVNNKYLLFDLKEGKIFEESDIENPIFLPNGKIRNKTNRPSRISTFDAGLFKIKIDGLSFSRSDEKIFSNKHEMLDVFKIGEVTDSLQKIKEKNNQNISNSLKNSHVFMSKLPNIPTDSQNNLNPISFDELNNQEQLAAINRTISFLNGNNRLLNNQKDLNKNIDKDETKYWIEFHRKFALTYSIIVLFFVGAPLGALIKKGGFGAPVVIAAIIFMIYFVLISIGQNLAETHTVSPFVGMWFAGLFFTPIAFYITWCSANDRSVWPQWKKK